MRLSAAASALLAVVALVGAPGVGGAATTSPGGGGRAAGPGLVLLSQTPWVTSGQVFDLHLRADAPSVPAAHLGVSVAVYPCLSSVSGFDQSLVGAPDGTPVSATSAPVAVSGLSPVPGGGFALPMPVTVGGSGTTPPSSAAPFTIRLEAVGEQCQSFPAGVYPVHLQLVDTSTGAVISAFTTHLVFTEAPADTQRLRVGVVLPVQATQRAASEPSPGELLIRPSAALATPPDAAVTAVSSTVDVLSSDHGNVPVTLQVSGQTVGLLEDTGHQATVAQLGQLAATPEVYQLTAAPFTPVDAATLVDDGLASELALQVSRGLATVDAATGRPTPAAGGLGAWITGDGLDPTSVVALAGDGFRQVVVPAGDLSSSPANGSTTQPFPLEGARGAAVTAMASDDDLTARFTSDPGNPVLAAHQLVAELAQLYYERPNAISPRAVLAVAPTTWDDDPAFVGALLGSLAGNPVVQAMTVAQVFALYPSPAPCRSGCRLTGGGGGSLPTAAIRAQRSRIDGFATSAVGARPLAVQLGDLVLGGEAQALRPAQQSKVVSNAGAALDAQLGQLAVEGDLTVTLTASSGTVPVTVVSNAAYAVTATLVLDSDKLLFPNGETQWSTPVTLLPRHSNVVYVRVRSRTSGTFRLDVALRSPDGTLRLASGELAIRSTSSSVVGVVLTLGAVVVLAVWWIRTSRRRRARARADESRDVVAGGGGTGGDDGDRAPVGTVPSGRPGPSP